MTLDGLIKRGEVYIYRRVVPEALRAIMGKREIKVSLGTADEAVAVARWRKVSTEVNVKLAEAMAGRLSPAVAGYKAVEKWTPGTPDAEWALNTHLEENATSLAPEMRAALLNRHDASPPLSLIFKRYYAERKLPAKTQLEWDLVLERIQGVCGGDVPVRTVTKVNVREFKDRLLGHVGRTGKKLSPATVKKNLGGLGAVLGWAKRNDYITVNPVEDMIVVTKTDDDSGRLPYSADDLVKLFSLEAVTDRKTNAQQWLPWLALYTGARLEELGQLRSTDVRCEEGVWLIAIEPGDGKRVKTKSSKRRVPIHPELIKLGFTDFVQSTLQGKSLFPELKATKYALTSAFSKWWGKHARAIVSDPRKTFHSFRHGWKDAARAVMPEEHHDAITGHSSGSVGRSYGTGVPLAILAASMARVSFPSLTGRASG